MSPGTFQGTYSNFKALAKRLEEFGNLGFQILTIEGLAERATAGDRETFYIEGTKIVCPMHIFNGYEEYNANVLFGVNLNADGEDSDEWFDFNTTISLDYISNKHIENVVFHKLTIRNYLAMESPMIKLWVFQDPFFINQVNKMLKDMMP